MGRPARDFCLGRRGQTRRRYAVLLPSHPSRIDVIPENVDAIRALMGTEADWKVSVAKTDAAISAYNGL